MVRTTTPAKLLQIIYAEDSAVMRAHVPFSISEHEEKEYKPILAWIKTLDYNNFEGHKVVALLERLALEDRVTTNVRFGREYSPVVYVDVHSYDYKTESHIDEKAFLLRQTSVIDAFKEVDADECWVDSEWKSLERDAKGKRIVTVRAWFD